MKAKLYMFFACVLGLGLVSAVFVTAAYSREIDAVEEGTVLELLNQVGGSVLGVAQSGNYAYVSVGPRLTVIDVQDPANPVFVGESEPLPGVAYHIEFTGSHVFAAAAGDMLVLDVSNPSAPTLVGTFNPQGIVSRFEISGSLAYVAERTSSTGGGGLRIVDISNPVNPSQVGFLGPIGTATDVAIWGNYAYLSGVFPNVDRIKVIDVSNPAVPVEANSINTGGTSKGLATDGTNLYLAFGNEGLWIYDISSPPNLNFVSAEDTFGDAQAVDVNGNWVYLAEGTTGLTYIDVTTPTMPVEVGTYQYPVLGHSISHVFYGNGQVYAANNTVGLRILDPITPTLTGFYEDPLSGPIAAVTSGDLAFVSDYLKGLRIMDISDGVNPVEVGLFDVPSIYYEGEVIGDLAYFATSGGLRILDISDTSNPTQTGSLNPGGDALREIDIGGNYAYLVQYSGGLYVMDISSPVSPTLAATYDTSGTSYDLALNGNYVYITDNLQDLVILDVSDPLTPTLAATYPLTGSSRRVKVEGQYAYVTTVGLGLIILDISDPVNPMPVASFPLNWFDFEEMEVVDGYVYLSGITTSPSVPTVAVIDVNDPNNPELFGSFTLPNISSALAVGLAEIYVPTFTGGLYILRGPVALLAENDGPTVLGQMTTFTATAFVSETLSYSWDFGDGNNGAGQVTTHTYGAAGQYTAVVVATGISETYTATTTVLVDEMIAGLAASNDSPTSLGISTTFTASITSGTNVAYSWSFGDGTVGVGATATHTYTVPGVFTATVTAENSVSTAMTETIVVVVEPISGLTATNDGPTALGNATTFLATITAGSGVSYTWDFGDGITGTGMAVTHTYTATGVYTAVVTATNILNTQVATTTVTIVEGFNLYMPAVIGKP